MAEKKLIKRPTKVPPKKTIEKTKDKSGFSDTVASLNKLTMPAPQPVLPPTQGMPQKVPAQANTVQQGQPSTPGGMIANMPAPTQQAGPAPIQQGNQRPPNFPNNSAVAKPAPAPKKTGEAAGQPTMNFYFAPQGLKY